VNIKLGSLGVKPTRKCKDCGLTVHNIGDMGYFVKHKGSKYGYRNLCVQCKIKENKNNAKQKDWKTDHQTKKRYGVDVETYKQRMSSADSCQICGSKKELCYDHCHDTMDFRGVLCRGCNRSLGQLGDNLEGIMKVVKYLEKAAK
jgi:hypothetical protein